MRRVARFLGACGLAVMMGLSLIATPSIAQAATQISLDIAGADVVITVRSSDEMSITGVDSSGEPVDEVVSVAFTQVIVSGTSTSHAVNVIGARLIEQTDPVLIRLGDGTTSLDIISSADDVPAIDLTDGAWVRLTSGVDRTLAEITLSGGTNAAGIHVCGSCAAELASGTFASIQGGQGAAGIGGNADEAVGKITISSSTVVSAMGGDSGAGIGGGYEGSGGTITIADSATVVAHGGTGGAGVGGGYEGAGGTITVTGGTLTSTGGPDAAGIGGGSGGDGGLITLGGGTTSATGGSSAAGIGGGFGGDSGTIDVGTGSTLTAAGGKGYFDDKVARGGGAGIGAGTGGVLTSVTIGCGASVRAVGGDGSTTTSMVLGPAYGYSGGGAAIGTGGQSTGYQPTVNEPVTQTIILPAGLAGLALIPGMGGLSDQGFITGGNGEAVGTGGDSLIRMGRDPSHDSYGGDSFSYMLASCPLPAVTAQAGGAAATARAVILWGSALVMLAICVVAAGLAVRKELGTR